MTKENEAKSENDEESMDEKQKERARQLKVLKNKFFHDERTISETHPHITDWFHAFRDKAKQNEIIENIFKKEGGKWKMTLDKPYFKECKTRCACVCACEHRGSLYNFGVLLGRF